LLEIKVKVVLLYLAGLMYRGMMYVLGFVSAIDEAVRL
jgi:hypothetical protein